VWLRVEGRFGFRDILQGAEQGRINDLWDGRY